jgi:hypothetical protein
MNNLRTEQLESIQRLLVDPLRETIRTEIQLSHDRLADHLGALATRLEEHVVRTERRMSAVQREVNRQRSFRRRVVAVYGVMMMLATIVWSAVRDKVVNRLVGR